MPIILSKWQQLISVFAAMRTHVRISHAALMICFLHSIWSYAHGQAPVIRGCVVYREHAFDRDEQAIYKEYSTWTEFEVVFNVQTVGGEPLTLTRGQEPCFIPYPSNATLSLEQANQSLAIARRRFPQLSRKLDSIALAWLKRPVLAPQAAPNPVVQPGISFTTARGVTYKGVEVTDVDDEGFNILHETGVAKILFANAPDDLSKLPLRVQIAVRTSREEVQNAKRLAAEKSAAVAEEKAREIERLDREAENALRAKAEAEHRLRDADEEQRVETQRQEEVLRLQGEADKISQEVRAKSLKVAAELDNKETKRENVHRYIYIDLLILAGCISIILLIRLFGFFCKVMSNRVNPASDHRN